MRAGPKRLEPNVDVKVAFISPCGFGNLGDVAIQDTFIQGVREQLGAVEIVGITQNPADTEDRHHVRAVAMDALAPVRRPELPRQLARRAPQQTG